MAQASAALVENIQNLDMQRVGARSTPEIVCKPVLVEPECYNSSGISDLTHLKAGAYLLTPELEDVQHKV